MAVAFYTFHIRAIAGSVGRALFVGAMLAITSLSTLQAQAETLGGLALAEKNNCMSCHKVNRKVVGPGLIHIAERYDESPETINYLVQSIREGSSGKWGPVPMPKQVQVSPNDARALVRWILSLKEPGV